jgi:glycerol-3-phosphate dehydrogenase subunit B
MSNAVINKDFDVLVIGTGVAGCVAATAIAAKGRSVALVGRFGGATAQSSGAVDVTSPQKNPEALSALQKLAIEVNLQGTERGLTLATEAGTIKKTWMAQQTQSFDLETLKEGDSIGLLGFSGLSAFDALAVAKTLSWSMSRVLGKEIDVKPLACDLSGALPWRSSLEMARAVDENIDLFAKSVAQAMKGAGQLRACLMPAVLGRAHYRAVWEKLQQEAPIYELLAMPHSVPGLRLHDALMNQIRKQRITLIAGEAIRAERANGLVERVFIDGTDGNMDIQSRAVIVCTGRFFSGGFERQGVRREKIFGLPLWHEGRLIEDLPSRQLTAPLMKDDQPLFCAAIRTDEMQRPYDRMMELFARNLFAAGSGIQSSLGVAEAALSGHLSAFHTLGMLDRE